MPRLSRLPLLDAVQLLLSLLGHSCGHVGCGCAGGGHRKPDIGRQSLGRSRGQGPVDSRDSLEIALGGCRCGCQVWSVLHSICFFTADWHCKIVGPSFSKIFTRKKGNNGCISRGQTCRAAEWDDGGLGRNETAGFQGGHGWRRRQGRLTKGDCFYTYGLRSRGGCRWMGCATVGADYHCKKRGQRK